NSAVFSLLEHVVLRSPQYTSPERLVRIWGGQSNAPNFALPISVPKFEHLRQHQHSFSAVAADFGLGLTLTGSGDPIEIGAERVTSNYFDVLGVEPFLGRGFRPDEETDGAPVAVVTHAFWVNRLKSDPGVLGRHITLDGVDHSVVGVIRDLPVVD